MGGRRIIPSDEDSDLNLGFAPTPLPTQPIQCTPPQATKPKRISKDNRDVLVAFGWTCLLASAAMLFFVGLVLICREIRARCDQLDRIEKACSGRLPPRG